MDRTLVITEENGIITDIMLASMCFDAFVRIIQHIVEEISVTAAAIRRSSGLNEKTISSSTTELPPIGRGKLRIRANTPDINTPTKDCTARYKGAYRFFAYTQVPAMLKPYSSPEIAQSASPIPTPDILSKVIPLNINALMKQVIHDIIVVAVGFFFTRIYMVIGTVMQERFSRKA